MLARRAVPAVLALALAPAWAHAQAGYEVLVPDTTSGFQIEPSAAAAGDGSFVVVWQEPDASSGGIFGRRFDPAGAPLAGQFQVNSTTVGNQYGPAVASSPDGSFIVAWGTPDGSGSGIAGQRYDAFGTPQGGEFAINSYTTSTQSRPAVAVDDTGAFVVVWESSGNKAGNGRAIFSRRYDAAGNPQGSEFQVSTFTTGDQTSPAVAYDPAGNFVVAWDSRYAFPAQDGSSFSVHGRRYDSAGVAQGDEFLVNLYTTSSQSRPAVATDAQGNFVVVWESAGRDGSSYAIASRRFDAAGNGGMEFGINAYTTSGQRFPSIARTSDGGFLVAWSSNGQDGSSYAVMGRRLAASGAATSSEFRVNVTTGGTQTFPSIASGDEGFVVTWQGPDGLGDGIFARTGPEVFAGDSADVPEGGSAAFVVTLSTPVEWTVAVDYATADGSATGSDYVAASGTLTFAPGVVSRTVTVASREDGVSEPDEIFHLDLSTPVLARIVDGRGDALIVDNDPPPALTIRDVTVREGNTGPRGVTLVVALSAPSGQTVLVDYATAPGTATAGSDYTTTAGTLTFPPFSREQRLTVTVQGDTSAEPNETFFVNLSNEMNAVLADGQARVTISDDDRRSPFFRGKKGSKSGAPRR